MLARTLEAAGLATVSLSLVREHTEMIRPPRALYVPFPFGMPLGRAGDAGQHRRVLGAALDLLDHTRPPVLADLADEADEPAEPASPTQASAVPRTATGGDVAAEVTRMRHYHERWVDRHGRTSVGLTGIPPTRFRGIVRFLEDYARGGDADHPERAPELALPYFVRYCVDDLKALYAEARFVMRPAADGDAVQRWLWGETALGGLLVRVRDRMQDAADPLTVTCAYGIAR